MKRVNEDFDADELLALARLSLERNDVEGALAKLKKVIGADEPPLEAVGLAARVYAQLRLFDRAENLFRRYLERNPNAVLEQFQLGMTRFDAGKTDDALKLWDGLLKDRPDFPPAMFYRSLALVRNGKAGEAKDSLKQLLSAVAVDNLYFKRAKELLQAIEAGATTEPMSTAGNGSAKELGKELGRVIPSDPYRTEH